MARPTSWAAVIFNTRTVPSSVSTSISAMWAPKPNTAYGVPCPFSSSGCVGGSNVASAVRTSQYFQSRLGGDLRQHQRGERGGLGGLEDDRVARRERGADLPRGHEQREVPRDHRADDAERARRGAEARVSSLSAQPAWWNRCAAAVGTSTSRLSRIGLPLSSVSRIASSRAARRRCARCGTGTWPARRPTSGPTTSCRRGGRPRPRGRRRPATRCRPRPAPPRWPG